MYVYILLQRFVVQGFFHFISPGTGCFSFLLLGILFYCIVSVECRRGKRIEILKALTLD